MIEALSQRLADHVRDTSFESLPTEAVVAAKRSLLDMIGVMLAASGCGEGCAAFSDIANQQGPGHATVLGFGYRVSPPMAAFANGAMSHVLDFEDSHDEIPVHPSATIVPVLLALAEAGASSGRDLLLACALGADITCRLGRALTEDMAQFGWYPPPILGAYGATAAAAKLLGLTRREILDAFSLTLCQVTCSGEIKHSPHSLIRGVRDAFPAKAAIMSAELARRGVRGFERPFEGEAGFFALFARGVFDPDRVIEGLGEKFLGAELSYKLWPSCRGTHAAIEAALALRKERDINPREIETIHLIVSPMQTMLLEPAPQRQQPCTAIDAKFSLPFTVASTLVHGEITLDSFAADALADPHTLGLAKGVTYEVSPRASMTSAVVQLILNDGSRLERGVRYPLGHPKNPAGEDALRAKFADCAARAMRPLSPLQIGRIIAAVEMLDVGGTTELLAAISPENDAG